MSEQPVYIQSISAIHPEGKEPSSEYMSANEPDYKTLITNATLRRRMSRIVKMGVACGLKCMNTVPADEVQAIITATGLGCLGDTEKFLNSILDNKEQLLNPTPFIQSTFNTIGGQIALIRQIHSYNTTYVHRGLSFETALLDAIMKIREGNKKILVGAIDEMTSNSHLIQKRLGLLKDTIGGEGAHFFLLSDEADENTLATVEAVEMRSGSYTTSQLNQQIKDFLHNQHLKTADIDCFITGNNGNKAQDCIYEDLKNELFPQSIHSTFKEECGEYPTASSYAVWKTIKMFHEEGLDVKTALIYNHYQSINHSLILIRKMI